MALLPLPSQVVSRIRSGVTLLSPSQCLAELILNSIDAGATSIVTHLDLSCHKMQVKDDGMGMTSDQLKLVGERYCTSKCHSVNDLSDLQSYGYRGEALASLREISGMMEIISKASSCDETYCKLFVQGKAKGITKSSSNREQNGTTITIIDFMYNLPVRKKMISETLDLEHCRSHLARIALIHPHISFILYNDITEEIILQTHKSKSILASFVTLFGQKKAEHLKAVHYSLLPYRITGFIGLESHISKDLQFLYINNHIVLKTKLHKIINSLLKKYLLVCHRIPKEYYSPNSNSPNKSLNATCQDRHAIFVINICCPSNSYDLCLEPKKSLVEFKDWIKVLNLIEKCICCFLKDNNIAVEESESSNNSLFCSLTGKICNDDKEINTKNTKNALFSLIAKRENELAENELQNQKIMEENLEEEAPYADNSEKAIADCSHINQEGFGQKMKSSYVMSRFVLGTSCNSSTSDKDVFSVHRLNDEFPNNKITSTLTAFKRKARTKEVISNKVEPKEKYRFITVGKRIIRLPTVMKPCHSKNALHQLKCTKESKFTKLKKSCESTRTNYRNIKSSPRDSQNTSIFNNSLNLCKSSGGDAGYFYGTRSTPSASECDFNCKKSSSFENNVKTIKIQEKEQNKILPSSLTDERNLKIINSSLSLRKTCKKISLNNNTTNKSVDVIGCSNTRESFDEHESLSEEIESHQWNFNLESLLDQQTEKTTQLFIDKNYDCNISPLKQKLESENEFYNQNSRITKIACNLTEVDTTMSINKDNIKCNISSTSGMESSQLHEKLTESDIPLKDAMANHQLSQTVNCISENDKTGQKFSNINSISDSSENSALVGIINYTLPVQINEDIMVDSPAIVNSNSKQNLMNIKFSSISNKDRLKEKLWICHEDSLSGQCIYVNSINANSMYSCPETEITAKNISTNMPENNARSHFFLSHNSTPFLPRLPLQRQTVWTKLKSRSLCQTGTNLSNLASCVETASVTANKEGKNVIDMFQNWKNPVFQKLDFKEVTNISLKEIAKREIKIYNLTQPHNLSKTELDNAKVIGQVDSKFIVCIVPKYQKDLKGEDFIILFDQHAVHERIRLEQLIQDLYEKDSGDHRMKLSYLEPSVSIILRPEELRIIKAYICELKKLGFSLHINDQNVTTVSTVPSCLLEKEVSERKRGKCSVTALVVENILKEWIQILMETGVTTSLPKSLLSVLNSQACHGAIKFGDHLEKTECSKLIKMLTSCKLPFQCAHGRPSLVPLVDLSSFNQPKTNLEKPQLWKLAKR